MAENKPEAKTGSKLGSDGQLVRLRMVLETAEPPNIAPPNSNIAHKTTACIFDMARLVIAPAATELPS